VYEVRLLYINYFVLRALLVRWFRSLIRYDIYHIVIWLFSFVRFKIHAPNERTNARKSTLSHRGSLRFLPFCLSVHFVHFGYLSWLSFDLMLIIENLCGTRVGRYTGRTDTFVELKTSLVIRNAHDEAKFER
jgi:hypothetical protein